jgi:phosphoglycolate phosphatase
MNGADSVDEKHTLVFDLDGTLICSAGDVTRSLNSYLKIKGYTGEELGVDTVRPMIGDGMSSLVAKAITAASMPALESKEELTQAVAEVAAIYDGQDYSGTLVLPGVKETLQQLHEEGHTMVLCTNKDQIPTEQIINHFQLGPFAAIVGGNFLPVRKPHAGHLITAVEMGGGDVNRCIMIGDGDNDVRVAQAAGVPSIALSWQHGNSRIALADLNPSLIVEGFEHIPEAIEKLVDGSTY